MTNQCQQCSKTFEVDEWEENFYRQFDVPIPPRCPTCRHRRRMSHRGRNFYMRPCDMCKQPSMSMYSPNVTGFTFYCNDCWQSDKWDPFDYGRHFDFSRPFFEQFYELYQAVPKHISNAVMSENSQYVINAHRNKNCYLLDEVDYCEDSYFGYSLQHSRSLADCLYVTKCELGYELIKCSNCYGCFYAFNSYDCTDCYFIVNCKGATNAILCANLRNTSYQILNKSVSKEEFQRTKERIFSGSFATLQQYLEQYEELKKKTIYPYLIGSKNNDVTGNYLVQCERVYDSYFVNNSTNAKYITEMHNTKDTMDTDFYEAELCYQCLHTGPQGNNCIGSHFVWFGNSIWYSDEIHYSQDIFGSCGLKRQKYVIFNTQYNQTEYVTLRDQIVKHMKSTGEWGEYLPEKYSPHGYNQTFAGLFYPMTKHDVERNVWRWIEDEPEFDRAGALTTLPDSIHDSDQSVCQKVILCQECQKPFKIIPQELNFYQKQGLPLPRWCPESRMKKRFFQVGPRQLWNRDCMCTQTDHGHKGKCSRTFATTYQPDRPEIIYCTECYIKTVL